MKHYWKREANLSVVLVHVVLLSVSEKNLEKNLKGVQKRWKKNIHRMEKSFLVRGWVALPYLKEQEVIPVEIRWHKIAATK